MSDKDPLRISNALAPHEVAAACDSADRQLQAISEQFDFLMCLSPTNTVEAMHAWFEGGQQGDPEFEYRDLPTDPAALRRDLHAIELTHLHEPLVEGLLIEKRHELDLQLELLEKRGTEEFCSISEQLYGAVSDPLHEAARAVLERTPRASVCRQVVGADELRVHAEKIIDFYREQDPEFCPAVEIRDDVSGLLVSYPKLMISSDSRVSDRRVDPLLSHELSIHMVTGFNGDCQHFAIFRSGLAGYEEIQEGLGVFAEWAVGGLFNTRLRLIAGRVIAVRAMLEGADFTECFGILRKECGIPNRRAFKLAARVYRSGGFAKDAIYLRGFFRVMEMLAEGGDLDPYWVGKIAPVHVPVVRDLHEKGLIEDVRLTPEFLARPDVQKRIDDYVADPTPEKWLSPVEPVTESPAS